MPPGLLPWPMRSLLQGLNVRLRHPLDPSVPVVARRFAVRLAIVLIFAALPLAPGWSMLRLFVMLTGFNALTCFIAALLLREKPNTQGLSHYDEGLWMAALCVIGWLLAGI